MPDLPSHRLVARAATPSSESSADVPRPIHSTPPHCPVALSRRLHECGAGHPERLGSSICHVIGRTPALALERFGRQAPRAALIAKLESRNPGGSVKDRTALGMVLDAEERGLIAPGMTLVEPTAGNTGIGLALVGRARGYEVVLVMPERYCSEKSTLCRALGASVITVPGAAAGMRECLEEARRACERLGGVMLNQFENPANPAIHELTTGPEMWEQCGGRLDAVVIGVGTGGTITGVVRALRRHVPSLEAFAVESQSSVLGGRTPIPSRIEGIGNTFIPATLDMTLLSGIVTVSDDDALRTVRDLASAEGILAGASSGAIVHAALEVARRLGPGRRVMTLVPDAGDRYLSKGLYASS